MRTSNVLGVIVTLLLAGACGGDGPDEPGRPTPTPTDGPATTPAASAGPDVTATFGTRAATAEGSGTRVNVTDVEVSTSGSYDQVVFTIGGDGTAGWLARYIDQPRQQGSGRPVELAGDAALDVFIRHTGYPQDTGIDAYEHPERIDGSEVIREVVYTNIYEGDTQFFVGIDARRPFRVFRLEDPERVVLHVSHGDAS